MAEAPVALLGDNFSGRSEWLAERRQSRPWPQSACIGPFPDTACTGLTTTVSEELTVASMCTRETDTHADFVNTLGLQDLGSHRIHTLSGGEAVRVALASVAAQNVAELHIDTSLEQLDEYWRSQFLSAFFAFRGRQIAARQYLVDNHLSPEEVSKLVEVVHFPQSESKSCGWSKVIDYANAATLAHTEGGAPVVFEDVTFSYSRASQPVLRRISLTLQPGSLYILSGPNGSGKTTLVKLLSGTLLPRAGIIRYGPHPFRPKRSSFRFASSAFQNPDYQWTSLTVIDELRKCRGRYKWSSDMSTLLPIFGIPEKLAHANPNELPFVFKKRLSTALALLAGKPWLIFDEPTLGQDRKFCVALAKCLQFALMGGAGILLISHDAYFKALFPTANVLEFGGQQIAASSS
jgi:energy-coupling factor transport system ATP-binding protein